MNHISKIFSVLLALVFAFATIGASPQSHINDKTTSQVSIANYLAAQENSKFSEEGKIKEAINAYFTTRYEGQKTLETQDFSVLVDDETQDWVKKEKDKREIELYIASLFDLGYQSYNFNLEYDAIDIKNNKAIIQLRESHEVIFNAIAPDVSKLGDLPHTITLYNKNGIWLIYKDEYEDELSQQLKHQTVDEIKKQIDKNYEEDKTRRISSSSKKGFFSPIKAPMALTNYIYNRTAAVNYANVYWSSYNTSWYQTYPGNDCTNFVSQAIYAGEGYAPPNTNGMTTSGSRDYNTDWYYIFNNPMGTQNGDGSLPWVRVQNQYNFITGNVSKIGPYGSSTTSLCSATAGDVVQLYNVSGNGIWDHEGIIVYAGNCGQLANYKVNAHTINRYQYPLTNWASFSMRFIRINGWRGN